jgi:iron complex transport system ATP-binding protein
MLTAANLVVRAGGRAIIDGVTAEFDPGRLHLIMGANGAGKSTLIKVLARLVRPASGSVRYDNTELAQLTDGELARHRAVLSQLVEVAFSMPVGELVMMGRYPHFSGRPGRADREICQEVMEFFDVTSMAERSYGTLSGGEKQRVQFARVLAQIWRPVAVSDSRAERNRISTRYLFLDEPLTFLDVRHQIDFMKKVRRFASQPDVVAVGVVHDLNLAARYADRLILLHEGAVIADGRTDEVLTAEHLNQAFGVSPVVLINPKSGNRHLAFE